MAGARRAQRVAAAIAAVSAITATLGGLPGAALAGAALPHLTATPTADLLDRHPVEVSGTGLTPDTTYAVAQCGAAATAACARPAPAGGERFFVPTNMEIVRTDAQGAFSEATLLVRRSLVVDGTTYDCAAGGCGIGLITPDGTFLELTPTSFQATGTYVWPEAALTASPTTGLVEHQAVQLTATGLNPRYAPLPPVQDPGRAAWIDQCRAVEDPGPDDCRNGDEGDWATEPVYYVTPKPDGTAVGGFRVHRFLDLPGGTVDCAVEACTIALRQDEGPVSNRVPIGFGPEWTPFADAVAFTDFLEVLRGGPIGTGEGAAIRAALAARTLTGADALSTEAETGASDPASDNRFVAETTRLYRAFFGRAPDAGGLQHWASRLRRGMSTVEVARRFGGTPEFQATYGTATNAQVVERAYRNTLGRAPDEAGLAYWTGRLDQGLARWKMLHGFARSPEFRSREQVRTAITLLVWRWARRIPTAQELLGTPVRLGGPGSVRNVAVDLLADGPPSST